MKHMQIQTLQYVCKDVISLCSILSLWHTIYNLTIKAMEFQHGALHKNENLNFYSGKSLSLSVMHNVH